MDIQLITLLFQTVDMALIMSIMAGNVSIIVVSRLEMTHLTPICSGYGNVS